MKTNPMKMYALWVLLITVFAGCAMMPQLNTNQERLFALTAEVEAVVATAADLRMNGVIDDDLYRDLDPIIHNARASITMAWMALGQGDLQTMQDYVKLINTLLWKIRDKLHDGGSEDVDNSRNSGRGSGGIDAANDTGWRGRAEDTYSYRTGADGGAAYH